MISSSISSSLSPMRRPPAVSRTAEWSTCPAALPQLADEPTGDIGNGGRGPGDGAVSRSPMITGVGCLDTGDFSGDVGWNEWIVCPLTTLSSWWRVAGSLSCCSPWTESPRPREMRRARSTERLIRVGLPGRLALRRRASGESRPAEPHELLDPKEPCEWRCVGLLWPTAGTGSVAEAVPLEHSTAVERSAELDHRGNMSGDGEDSAVSLPRRAFSLQNCVGSIFMFANGGVITTDRPPQLQQETSDHPC